MNASTLRTSLATLALAGVTALSLPAPAKADGAATTRTIIGAAAAIAGIATAINVENKHRQAGQVVGYLSDGSAVYADGHVVSPNGNSWYPNQQGQQIACNGQQCSVYANGQNNYGYNNGYGYNTNNGYPNSNNGYYNNGYNNGGYYYGQSNSRNNGERHRDNDRDGNGPGN